MTFMKSFDMNDGLLLNIDLDLRETWLVFIHPIIKLINYWLQAWTIDINLSEAYQYRWGWLFEIFCFPAQHWKGSPLDCFKTFKSNLEAVSIWQVGVILYHIL